MFIQTNYCEVKMKKQQLKTNIFIGISAGLLLIIIIMSVFLFLNYDYLFFKHFISSQYVFTETLDKMYRDNIGIEIQSSKDYYKYFDNLAIALISKEIKEKGEDPFTYQYTPSEHDSYLKDTANRGNLTYIESISDNTIFLRFTNFSKESMNIFKASIKELKNYPNIIIDLRNNTGGGLESAFELSSYFLHNKDISYIIQYRNQIETTTVKADGILMFDNIIILQNENTASASEIFINALKSNLNNIRTVGTKTYGKGVGQTTYKIKNGFYVKATTFLVLTPDQNTIHKTGIEPDYIYKNNESIIDFCMSIIQNAISK